MAVAVLATTLITSLGLLVTATEAHGVRGSFAAIPPEQTVVSLRLVDLSASVEDADAAITAAVQKVLGPSVGLTSTAVALTDVGDLADGLPVAGAAYFGQLDDVQSHATLVTGSWAGDVTGADGRLPVVIPENAAMATGLTVGSSFGVTLGSQVFTAEVVGLYTAQTDGTDYWALDPLRGGGYDPVYPKPGLSFYTPIPAFGPLLVAPGELATADVPVSSLQVSVQPDFSAIAVDDLGPLIQRLSTADVDLRTDMGRLSEQLAYVTDAGSTVSAITSGLVVTRSTVVVVSLLLLVLAIAAMAQTARLFTDARAGERGLMRSRGAAAGHLLALTALEALGIAIVTAAASPLLAAQVYRLVAAQPAMVAAGMPATVNVSALAWVTAAAVALVFAAVLVAPLVGRARTLTEDHQALARPSRASGFMRAGVDVALIVLAALAYWQLVSYRGVLDPSGSLAIDPILAVGPALVLLAGALLCVRLIGPASRLIEALGSRSRHTVLPLASWELGRRPTRAVAAVLLLSLALAVGTFGLSFLSTWRQSQLDQAAIAIGAPVRAPASDTVFEQAGELQQGTQAAPAAVFRRSGLLTLDTDSSQGVSVQVLALAPSARAVLDRGRLAEVGGTYIESMLQTPTGPADGVDLAAGAREIATTARLVGEGALLEGQTGHLRAIIESTDRLLTTIELGTVAVDGEVHAVSAELPEGSGMRVVGIQVAFDGDLGPDVDGPATDADVTLDLGQFSSAGALLPSPSGEGWMAAPNGVPGARSAVGGAPNGWMQRLTMTVPANRTSAFALVGWKPVAAIKAVVPTELADKYQLQSGSLLNLATQSATVHLDLRVGAPLIPGAATSDELDALGYGLGAGSSLASTLVVDHESLARALVQAGVPGTMVDEWWLDVAAGDGAAYVAAHPLGPGEGTMYSSDALGSQLQQAPLRVATQAALWVSIAAGALLAAIGFAMHSAATLRARRVELAQLRAIGLTRRGLVALVGAESLLLCVLGIVFGVSIGLVLASLVAPLVAVSPDGSPPIPAILLEVPVGSIAVLAAGMVAVLALVVLVVAVAQRRTRPADLLRGGVEL